MRLLILALLVVFSFTNCQGQHMELSVVQDIDIERYLGKWYEIARFPHSFEKKLKCVTAEYAFKKNGKISVLNKGYLKTRPEVYKIASGTAWIPDKNQTGKLKVRFFWPFAGNYWIIDLDKENYQYALVGENSRNYLWILCREKTMDQALYEKLVKKAKDQEFDVSLLEKVEQNCD